jgi:hypothetical protein
MRGLRAQQLQQAFSKSMDWEAYLATDPDKATAWMKLHDELQLSPEQSQLLQGFTRRMRVLFISGIWCGDCVRQGPIFQMFAEATPTIELGFLDRDTCPDIMDTLCINAGRRVPMIVFMAEDFEPVSVGGDRTLNYYRHMAAARLGATCPMPGAPTDEGMMRLATQDWLDECERVHLLLRLSGRLRQHYGD